MANSGASKLAQVIAERISSQTARPDALELGIIQPDMSLKIDRFAVPIPQGEYLISEWTAKLILPAFSLLGVETCMEAGGLVTTAPSVDSSGSPLPGSVTKGLAQYSFNPAEINKVAIEIKPELKPGDRVLVAWVNDGTDPVVVSKVVSS